MVRRVSQPGESAGLALVMLTEGGGTSEAPGPHGTSLPSPPDRLGASGLCQRLWPLQTPIYMTRERSALDQREGKYEPDSSTYEKNPRCQFACNTWTHVWLR